MVSRRRAAVLVLLTASFSLLAGFARVNRCVGQTLAEHEYYQRYCYSDIRHLYFERGFADDLVPYVESFNEYPVLTGAIQWATARRGGGEAERL